MFLIWFGLWRLWFRNGFGCDFDMVWERDAFFSVPDGLASRNETETTRGSLLVDFSRVLVVLIWYCYGFDTILIQVPYDFDTSSTAQGGGGSFKHRKPIGEVGCCESGMAERSRSWIERWLISLTILSFSDYLPTYLPIYLSISLSLSSNYPIYLSIYPPIYLSIDLSIYLSLSLSFICLAVYLSIYLSTCLSVVQCHWV